MALEVCSINSGSNGNCYYIGNHQNAILVDAGISCRETEVRLKQAGLSIKKIRAIIISHEHTDHIRGLERLATRYNLPVYITQNTLIESKINLPNTNIRNFTNGSPFFVEDLQIHPFSKPHDATDPYSFMISHQGVNVGVFTDIGISSPSLEYYFSRCHAVFLESNYDEDMLANGPYPIHLQRRISGEHGHLSNKQALQILQKHASPVLTHVFLSHLSEKNNHPEVALKTFSVFASKLHISVANRNKVSEVYTISEKLKSVARNQAQLIQMSLF